MDQTRRAAVSTLRAWSKGHAYAEALVERHAQRQQLSSADRGLLNAIVLGVIRNRRLLDHWIGKLRSGKLDHETRDILRVGLCQLLILNLPDHAAVFETVEAGKRAVRGLINAVLRRAAAQRKELIDDLPNLPPAVAYSHPDWMFNRWKALWGLEETVALMAWNNQPAETFARVIGTCENLPPSMSPLEGVPGFYRVNGPVPFAPLAEGRLYIQDPATRHSVELLDPQPGETILDACAAPGGKAALIAEKLAGHGELVCTDSNEKRLPRLRENLERLHRSDVRVECHDWTQPAPANMAARFDAILLDVPCSNTGVLRRRVDARWRLQPEHITLLADIQRSIITHALPCLKAGGRLVYSTCSIDPEENEQIVARVLAEHPQLRLERSLSVLPQRDATDGAYAALLRLA
jgi:16S rRNA (cytosine967-C5)-methyltransferase